MTIFTTVSNYLRSSLPRKFVLTVVVVNILLIGALGWELLGRDRELADYRRLSQTEHIVELLAVAATRPLAQGDRAELDRLARTAADATSVDHVVLADAVGQVVASAGTRAGSAPTTVAAPPSLRIARNERAFVVTAPVTSGGRMVGAIQVATDRVAGFPVRRDAWIFAWVYGLAAIFVTGLIAFLTARGVTARLGKLAALADRFRQGDHGVRLKDSSPDEVGSVARGVNEMLDAIAESERALKDAFRIAQIGAWRYTPADRRLHLSDTLQELVGMEAGGPPATTAELADKLSLRQRHKLAELLEKGEPGATYSFTFPLCAPGGAMRTFWAEARVELRPDTGERFLAGVGQDITEREAAANQLRQAQKMEAVGQLTGGLAHDFNNLLAIVIGNLDLLEESLADDPEVRELVGEAMAASLRGSDLTRQLLSFSRRQTLSPQKVDLNHLMSGMASLWRRTLGEAIEVRLYLGEGLWPTLADPSGVETAVLNLVINARDAMPDGGVLTVETSNRTFEPGNSFVDGEEDIRPGDYAVIAVSDNGTGMPPEVVARAFEPFFTTKPVGRGSGLGLSMIYGFAKQSGGTVRIYSEAGQGTTVRLYLPRYGIGKLAEEQAEEAPPIPMAANETILLVEDNDGVRRIITRHLEDLGYSVLTAANGPEALEMLKATEHVDLLFTDVVMPGGMNGFELGRRARIDRPGLKILYTSGFTRPAPQEVGATEPAPELLAKPYRKIELAQKLRELLDQPGSPP